MQVIRGRPTRPTAPAGTCTDRLFGPETSNPGRSARSASGDRSRNGDNSRLRRANFSRRHRSAQLSAAPAGRCGLAIGPRWSAAIWPRAELLHGLHSQPESQRLTCSRLNETYDGTSSGSGRHAAIRRLVPVTTARSREQHVTLDVQERRPGRPARYTNIEHLRGSVLSDDNRAAGLRARCPARYARQY